VSAMRKQTFLKWLDNEKERLEQCKKVSDNVLDAYSTGGSLITIKKIIHYIEKHAK
jgi:hypothetical protein